VSLKEAVLAFAKSLGTGAPERVKKEMREGGGKLFSRVNAIFFQKIRGGGHGLA